jgi:hypothetical protein
MVLPGMWGHLEGRQGIVSNCRKRQSPHPKRIRVSEQAPSHNPAIRRGLCPGLQS